MKVFKNKFKFKGSRDYVHGTDMYSFMLATSNKEKLNIRFSVHETVRFTNCNIYSTVDKNELNEVNRIFARCQFDVDGVKHYTALSVLEEVEGKAESYEYDESKVINLCHFSDETIKLESISPYTFIETIVAMNKKLHEQMFPDAIGRWVFTRLDLESQCDAKSGLSINFKHNMNFRLTKSEVLVNDVKIGDIYFSLVKL